MSAERHELEQLLTVGELAEKLRKTKVAIYLMAERRQIPHLKIGKSLRFRPSEIEAWLAEKGRESSNPK
jgi:excisionase family DNA binding protein